MTAGCPFKEMMGGGTFRPGGGGGRSIQEPPSPSSVSLRPQGTVKGGPGGMGMRMESQGGGPGKGTGFFSSGRHATPPCDTLKSQQPVLLPSPW